MKYTRNMKDVKEGGSDMSSKFLISEGVHELIISEIIEKVTKNGDPMVIIKLECNIGDKDVGKWCFDNILIPEDNSPTIAIMGRSKHFLHCIGEPYDNDGLDIDPDKWLWKKVSAEIFTEKKNDFHKYDTSKIKQYILVEGLNPEVQEQPKDKFDDVHQETTLPGEEMFA